MQPAGTSNVAMTLRDYGSLLNVQSSPQDKEDIYTPLRCFLNAFQADTLQQPGVRESLAELKAILQKDPQANAIIGQINHLSQQASITPAAKATAPKFADRDGLQTVFRHIHFTLTFADDRNQEYKDKWKNELEAECQKEGYAPLTQVLDHFEKGSALLREAEIQQKFKDMLDLIKKYPSTPRDLVHRLEQFNKRFDVRSEPVFVRFPSSEVNIKRNLKRQLEIISDNVLFYMRAALSERNVMEFHTFCRGPFQSILDQLRTLPETEAQALLSQGGVQETLREALGNYQKRPYRDDEDQLLIARAQSLITQEPVNPGLQPLPSQALYPAAAEATKPGKVPEPLVYSGEPSEDIQRVIDHLANFLTTLQTANKEGEQLLNDPNLMLNMTIAIAQLPDLPHPEIQSIVKELAKALRIQNLKKQLAMAVNSGPKETESLNAQQQVLNRLEKKIEKFTAPLNLIDLNF